MAAWTKTINIKQYLNPRGEPGAGREGDDDILTIAQNIAKELKENSHVFGSLPDKLVSATKEAIERVPDDKDYHELKFNKVLARIYDVADDERIWLGLM